MSNHTNNTLIQQAALAQPANGSSDGQSSHQLTSKTLKQIQDAPSSIVRYLQYQEPAEAAACGYPTLHRRTKIKRYLEHWKNTFSSLVSNDSKAARKD
ncbi:MAG: hypothetical protein M1812_006476 [Candelaria pacifica]|nr:MAG: hypothetical protein M1812_006476 [Candelaria pacifica]